VQELQLAVKDLRDLANGLAPSTLSDEGLRAALQDLVSRTPVPVHVSATADRFPSSVEETAWYIACEAVANAVKHAAPRSVRITAIRRNGHLHLSVADDGLGGADPAGSGIRGIIDRAETLGGTLAVTSAIGVGTTVTADLPCES
jgi:signal transduction histidine kinase